MYMRRCIHEVQWSHLAIRQVKLAVDQGCTWKLGRLQSEKRVKANIYQYICIFISGTAALRPRLVSANPLRPLLFGQYCFGQSSPPIPPPGPVLFGQASWAPFSALSVSLCESDFVISYILCGRILRLMICLLVSNL